MKAWSLWQPWASAWLSPIKNNETRSWELHHRGALLVHATKTLVSDCGVELDELLIVHFGPEWRSTLPRGALIGVVTIIDCKSTNIMPNGHEASDDYVAGDFSPDRFAIERAPEFKVFKRPIPYRGRQRNLFDVPYEIVRDQVQEAA